HFDTAAMHWLVLLVCVLLSWWVRMPFVLLLPAVVDGLGDDFATILSAIEAVLLLSNWFGWAEAFAAFCLRCSLFCRWFVFDILIKCIASCFAKISGW
ncbi:hypothetical protein U1Q18_027696, partial [Sarracenia purpurea var. burkii]